MEEVVAVDIGGTHARFAIARIEDGNVASLGDICTLKTAEHASFETAWEAFAGQQGRELPRAASIAIAGPAKGDALKLTNNPWVLLPREIPQRLGLDRLKLINDFESVAHAVAALDEAQFRHLCGPERPLPESGVISIIGPGTGLGVAQLIKFGDGYHVVPTEGGHIDFAPLDSLEDRILAELRPRFRRVSIERIASGMGLCNIYAALASIEGRSVQFVGDKALWEAALSGSDALAAAAADRFFMTLGAAAGDIALAHGAEAVVIAGGLGQRLVDHLPRSNFRARFVAKGRFEQMMSHMPVKIIRHPEPGLFGAAAAFIADDRGLAKAGPTP